MRFTLLAAVLFVCLSSAARADRLADYTPLMRAATSEISVIGKVISIEKENVEATTHPTANEKTAYTIAVVKVETNIRGAKGVTHLRVGFFPGSSGTGGTYKFPTLTEGQEVCVFLNKHHDGGFYIFPVLSPPLTIEEKAKPTVDKLRRAALVFEDPAKALKAEKPEDRAEAACLLILHYRSQPFNRPTTTADVSLAESQAILKVLAESEWTSRDREFNPSQAFLSLGLLNHPKFAKIQSKPGEDLKSLWQAELKRWLAEEGKNYQIQKYIPKAK